MVLAVLAVAIGYFSGSISSAILACRALGHPDPRTGGSGNPGATNVLRLHGKTAAALTLAGDVLKGYLPVWLAQQFGLSPLIAALAGLAAFVGHLYPIFFGFRGGKGVATYIGMLAGVWWLLALLFLATWGLIAAVFRISSLAGLTATAVIPLAAWGFGQPLPVAIVTALAAALIYWRHRGNIRRLLAGKEDRIGFPGTNKKG
jgi:glycerol-3-phosphate acyltransferase PlsY